MLSLIDLITLHHLWHAFKPRSSLHPFPWEQLIYSTFEIDLLPLKIISGLTILFKLALLLAELLLRELWCDVDLHLHLCQFKLSKPFPQNSLTAKRQEKYNPFRSHFYTI